MKKSIIFSLCVLGFALTAKAQTSATENKPAITNTTVAPVTPVTPTPVVTPAPAENNATPAVTNQTEPKKACAKGKTCCKAKANTTAGDAGAATEKKECAGKEKEGCKKTCCKKKAEAAAGSSSN